MNQPVEARCDHCKQIRPLFLYEPDHNVHVLPVACEWCDRQQQPLLCSRCWGKERGREESAPMGADEEAATAFFIRASRNNARIFDRQEADKATCEGIARATEQAEGGAR
ncbi:hypothetical protein [Streptomyces noursei]|uniref:hypothetical protein n=1 Tax=Streptomyces noursei TaxID=1971 RepID=UPI001671AE3F|nr:hypothetical protein [Streptomyces noursei]MCZ1014030.1 hypothetical protein [Streptomyces noursei]GGX49303.1 hypothetical protein GCM10010341_83700 [Streptomyces noursei]